MRAAELALILLKKAAEHTVQPPQWGQSPLKFVALTRHTL